MKKLFQILLASLLLPLLVAGCGILTPSKPLDVGAVVEAPKETLPAVPLSVQQTSPKPVGYFQCSLLTYLGKSCEKPTPSTTPSATAEPIPTKPAD